MVVKPWGPMNQYGNLVLPGIKCRGREYLRLVYGLDYDTAPSLDDHRRRQMQRKSAMAKEEYALGVEALERFVRAEDRGRVAEAVAGVLAVETQAVDSRL